MSKRNQLTPNYGALSANPGLYSGQVGSLYGVNVAASHSISGFSSWGGGHNVAPAGDIAVAAIRIAANLPLDGDFPADLGIQAETAKTALEAFFEDPDANAESFRTFMKIMEELKKCVETSQPTSKLNAETVLGKLKEDPNAREP